MTRRITHMTLEGGVLFFEDGSEVSGVSVDMLKAARDMLKALEGMVKPYEGVAAVAFCSETCKRLKAARAAITKAKGKSP